MVKTENIATGSFRDPSGFVFRRDGKLYRQINTSYKESYDLLMKSGLYDSLVEEGLLVPHTEVNVKFEAQEKGYKVIEPEVIRFISYPYEWCFSQLRDAATATLKIQRKALEFGVSLKDCSAYNIQFRANKPILIDSLSFEKYRENSPWVAYRQFCQHFLAPLALMCYTDYRLNQLQRIYIDGVPLDMASRLLPLRTRFRPSLLMHIHLHSASQKRFENKTVNAGRSRMSGLSLRGLIDNLESTIGKLRLSRNKTVWSNYYEDTNYSPQGFEHKKKIVANFLDNVQPESVWDLGGNTGVFSRIAGERGINTISFDVDAGAVEKNYLECVSTGQANVLPLVVDLTNPSAGIGWENRERMSLLERGAAEMVFALALIHHLSICNNVPLNRLAAFFRRLCQYLVIEFIPKEDSQVQRLLASREDVFEDYNQDAFERELQQYFTIEERIKILDSQRTLYLMRGL